MTDYETKHNGAEIAFQYKGHECEVHYWNVTPRFVVDGDVFSPGVVEGKIGHHAGRGRKSHIESLKEFVDEENDD